MDMMAGMMTPMLEQQLKAQMTNFKHIDSGTVDTNGHKAIKIEFEGEKDGFSVHNHMRVYMSGKNMLMITAQTKAADWSTYEKALKESLDSLTFSKTKAAAEKP